MPKIAVSKKSDKIRGKFAASNFLVSCH